MYPLRHPAKARAPRSLIVVSIRLAQRYARARRRTRAAVQKPFQRRGETGWHITPKPPLILITTNPDLALNSRYPFLLSFLIRYTVCPLTSNMHFMSQCLAISSKYIRRCTHSKLGTSTCNHPLSITLSVQQRLLATTPHSISAPHLSPPTFQFELKISYRHPLPQSTNPTILNFRRTIIHELSFQC
jgi:hypothetical protein